MHRITIALLVILSCLAIPTLAEGIPGQSEIRSTDSAAQQHILRSMEFCHGKEGEGRLRIDLSDIAVRVEVKRQGTKLILEFGDANLADKLKRRLNVADFGTPVDIVDAFMQGGNARVVVTSRGDWEPVIYQVDTSFTLEIQPKNSSSGDAGEKLTRDFQNLKIRDALNVIQDTGHLNLVISDSVDGGIAWRLQNVPWDKALDAIVASKGLYMRKEGRVVAVAPVEEVALFPGDFAPALPERLHTESFKLCSQNAEDLAPRLVHKEHRILSEWGRVVVDKRTNTLFVRDTKSRLEEVRRFIEQVDVCPKRDEHDCPSR